MRTVSALAAALSLALAGAARADEAERASASEAPPPPPHPPPPRPGDTPVFDMPPPAGDLPPRAPILEDRRIAPWIEARAKEQRFAAVTVGAGAGLIAMGGLTFLAGVMKDDGKGEGSTARWIGGIGAGVGVLVFGTGLFTYATLPGPPEGDLSGR